MTPPPLRRSEHDRRAFLQAAAAIAAAATAPSVVSAEDPVVASSPASQIRIGVMGVNGRGNALAKGLAAQPNVVVQAICDVDQKVLDRVVVDLEKHTGKAPTAHRDFRTHARRYIARCRGRRCTQSLARTGDHLGLRCWEACVCREAL